jgi:uncharacterized protein (TIGR02099 family)
MAYFPGWPRAEELEADVRFRNRSLVIEAIDGKVFDLDVERISAAIDDLDGGVLRIRGLAHGDTDRMLHFLRESPLQGRLEGFLRHLQATGENGLDLTLVIPLNPNPNHVEGIVSFEGNGLLAPELNLDFSDMHGRLTFTADGLSSDRIDLRFRGDPATLTIEPPLPTQREPTSRIRLRGAFELQTLLGEVAAALAPHVSGRTDWDLTVSVPATARDLAAGVDIAAVSDLRGIVVTLPPPFGKRADEIRRLTVRAKLPSGEPLRASVNYGHDIEAAIEFAGLPSDPHLERGELRIDAGTARLPEWPGLAVVANLQEFDISTAVDGRSQFVTLPAWISGMEVQVQKLTVRHLVLTNVNLIVSRHDDAAQVDVTGGDVAGRIRIPAVPDRDHPVQFDIRRLVLQEVAEVDESAALEMDPRTLPAVAVRVEELILGDKPLGELSMSVVPRVEGIHLERLHLRSDQTQLNGSGSWLMSGGKQQSSLRIEVHSRALGQSLGLLGIDLCMERGETDAEFDLKWPASMSSFAAAMLGGQASIRIGRGQLRKVDPGVGRMMGLLNLGALSRRLALDFSDLFDEGLGFDRIEGTFTLRNGQAHTSDLIIEAPSGLIHIDGRVGIATQDYDAIVTVVPRIGTALPIAGALAGGPAVGAALLVAEWLLERGIDEAASRRYALTGPWDEPVVRPIVAPAAAPADRTTTGGNR